MPQRHDAAVDARPVRARRGKLGLCAACNTPVAEHFNTDGEFIGCTEAELDTVFILVAANGRSVDPATIGRRAADEPPPTTRVRKFRVASYTPTDGVEAKLDDFTDNRKRTAKALIALHRKSHSGVLAREITARSGLPRGAVAESLQWLRDHRHVTATEAESDEPSSKP